MEKFTDKDPETKSTDIIAENIGQLKVIFPEVFTEGRIDFEVLKQLLGGAVDEREEKYGLNWHGKRNARLIALTPSTGTLRPCPEESVDWDKTQNIMIEGDNLEVLKLLQKSYAGKIKIIYIDPPYNTGGDLVYPDDFKDNIKNYLELTGQIESGKTFSTNTEASGRFHTDWINMIYPRLKLARNLLKDDGILFVSINDRELSQLRSILNEIFGEENFVANLIWDKGHSAQAGIFKVYHEYVLGYAKNLEYLGVPTALNNDLFEAGAMKRESNRHQMQDFKFPAGVRVDGPDGLELKGEWGGIERVELIDGKFVTENGVTKYPVTLRAAFTQRNQMEQYFYGDRENLIDSRGQKIVEFYFTSSGKIKVIKERGVHTPDTTLSEYGTQSNASTELAELFGIDEPPINNPKPVKLMSALIKWFTQESDIVMDFFAGSGTVGHAVYELNQEFSNDLRYIVVQLPEILDKTIREQKAGADFCDSIGKPTNIAEICKERLRRAGKKVKEEHPMFTGDIGFRVFKLDSSNIRAWEPDRDNLVATLDQHAEHLKVDRIEQDILYELLLKLGLDLTVPIQQKTIAGKTVHSIGAGTLLVCLVTEITVAQVEPLALGIIDWYKQLAPAGETQVIFRDSAFADDVAKTNLTAILQQYGLENVRSI